ncbi:MAG: tagatose 1,6-diphosphate aldolase [Chloroflexales bacterium]|nr:tagatose 1,6-diphosphate aldolase [Chloroflexales bacterium]
MKKTLTPGKWRGLKVTSNHQHTFAILAFDQRGNYRKMLPDGTSYAEAVEIKREIVSVLSPYVTAVLLDPDYGLAAALDAAGTSGLLMALEKTGYAGDATARQVDFFDEWTTAKIKRMGASAVKLLVYYHPDTEIAADIEAVVQHVASACVRHDLPLFVEPLAYSPDPATPADSAAFAAQRPRIVCETARRLGRLADVLKLEFPIDSKYNQDRSDWRDACDEVTQASPAPWVLLSAGVDFEVFRQQVAIACQNGASGFLAGRAIWKEAIAISASDRQTFLSTTSIQRVNTLREITERYGHAWTNYFAAMTANENWFQAYSEQ